LGARLLKDVALAARGPRRIAFAKASTRRYQALFQRFGGLYGAVNAATMTLVAGDRARAGEPWRRRPCGFRRRQG
jgi:hypothetical protein